MLGKKNHTESSALLVDFMQMRVQILTPKVHRFILVVEDAHIPFSEIFCHFLNVWSILACEGKGHLVLEVPLFIRILYSFTIPETGYFIKWNAQVEKASLSRYLEPVSLRLLASNC